MFKGLTNCNKLNCHINRFLVKTSEKRIFAALNGKKESFTAYLRQPRSW